MFRTACGVRRGKSVHHRVNQTILCSLKCAEPLNTHASYFRVLFLLMMIVMIILLIIIVLLQLIMKDCNVILVENQERKVSMIRLTHVRICEKFSIDLA